MGCWRISTNQKVVEKATMESKTEGTMWQSIQNCVRDSCQKWPCILSWTNYRENKQCVDWFYRQKDTCVCACKEVKILSVTFPSLFPPRHGYIQRWLLYNATTLYNICRFKSCISKKPTNIAVTKNVVTNIAIQHMLVKCCTPTFWYNILFNKVVIFCANQHQPYNNIFESCM